MLIVLLLASNKGTHDFLSAFDAGRPVKVVATCHVLSSSLWNQSLQIVYDHHVDLQAG